MFDITTGPNGNLLVPETVDPGGASNTSTIWKVRQDGAIREWTEVTTTEGSPLNGIEANGHSRTSLH